MARRTNFFVKKKTRARKCQAHIREHRNCGSNTQKRRWDELLVQDGRNSDQLLTHVHCIARVPNQIHNAVEANEAVAPT